MNKPVAILGAAGAVGIHVTAELDRRGITTLAVGRDLSRLQGTAGQHKLCHLRGADLSRPEEARAACAGAASIVYAVGVPYHRFDLHPKLMSNVVEAAKAEGVQRLLVISSVYSYGAPQTQWVAEDHPRQPQTRKGALRKQQEDIAMAAHASGDLQVLVLHLPDFLGPYASQSFSTTLFQAALANKTAT
ncbi:MAG: NAD(P)H-binding protein, partial [Bryobacterales bacterium]|nr:NAD(P)H-binding protein [Bryobacterales bacterium]